MTGAIVYELITKQDLDIGTGEVDKTNPGGGTVRCNRVNLASLAYGTYSASWTPGTVANASRISTNVTIVGAVLGDFVLVAFSGPAWTSALILSAYVSAADTVTVVITNTDTGLQINPGVGTLKVALYKTDL